MPKPETHVCLGCGRDTTAKSMICRECASAEEHAEGYWSYDGFLIRFGEMNQNGSKRRCGFDAEDSEDDNPQSTRELESQ